MILFKFCHISAAAVNDLLVPRTTHAVMVNQSTKDNSLKFYQNNWMDMLSLCLSLILSQKKNTFHKLTRDGKETKESRGAGTGLWRLPLGNHPMVITRRSSVSGGTATPFPALYGRRAITVPRAAAGAGPGAPKRRTATCASPSPHHLQLPSSTRSLRPPSGGGRARVVASSTFRRRLQSLLSELSQVSHSSRLLLL